MKLLVVLLVMAAPIVAAGSGQIVHESPFICDLSKLTAADRARLQEIAGALAADRPTVRELPDGYAFEFRGDADTFRMVADWLASERLCCPFFDIQIRTAPEGGPITVTLGGRPGTKDFIRLEFEKWIR
jgi:hypothetical protein